MPGGVGEGEEGSTVPSQVPIQQQQQQHPKDQTPTALTLILHT